VPERIIVAVVGGVSTRAVADAARRHLGGLEAAAGAPLGSPAEPARAGFRFRRMVGDIRRAQVLLGYRAAAALSDDDYALRVLAHVLGGGRASRLHQAVKERDALVDGIAAGLESFHDLGVLTVQFEGDPKNVLAAERSTQGEIERLRRHP